MKNIIKSQLLLLFLSLLFACGGGSGGDVPVTTTGDATASAGADQDVNLGDAVNLDGTGSRDPDDQTLTYTWTQVSGPDVTGGSGTLNGVTASFLAPDVVSTLEFDLHVNDGDESAPDRVQINVMEDRFTVIFVDDVNGNDVTGDGTRSNPFASISQALTQVTTNAEDIYLKSIPNSGNYDESVSTITLPAGTSLYGGYGDNWLRNVSTNRTVITGAATAIEVVPATGPAASTISGLEITATATVDPTDDTRVIYSVGDLELMVRDNTLIAERVAGGASLSPGSSFGVYAIDLSQLHVLDNSITTGDGGDGDDGLYGLDGVNGGDAISRAGGVNPDDASLNGFNGGRGGYGVFVFCPGSYRSAAVGEGPDGGVTGDIAGNGGVGIDAAIPGDHSTDSGSGVGAHFNNGHFVPSNGGSGGAGENGTPGSGGGGEDGWYQLLNPSGCRSGGDGGGGGAAALAGVGGTGSVGSGASIGLYLYNITQIGIDGNDIVTGDGGDSGDAGNGGDAAVGGEGFVGLADGGAGGRGGNSTAGGDGAGGGGGPSFGIFLGPNISGVIDYNNITTGRGGEGGYARHGDAGDGGWSVGVFYRYNLPNVIVGSHNTYTIGDGGLGGSTFGTGSAGIDGESHDSVIR